MNRSLRNSQLLLFALLSGCAPGTQIVRAPLISPVVIPAPEAFRMNVAVKNFSESGSIGPLWLWVQSEYHSGSATRPCSQFEALEVGTLAPGQSWGRSDYRIDRDGSCQCVKDQCQGHVWLSLRKGPIQAPKISGPNTALHVSWSSSGNLAEMTIAEF